MANTFYPKGAEKMLTAAINYSSDTIKVGIVSDAYTYSTAHEFLSDAGTLVGTAQTLGSKAITGGVFDAADPAFGAIAPGSTAKALIMWKDTGNPATSPLLAYLDQLTGFPFATNGGAVTVPWSNGAGKIFSLMPA
ncbi:hypothetical protein C8C93_2079 [Acidovorax sp. 93]|uniref:hypothetical protein n=1 Tax=Acidovorax sp. 93 TaxID=2135632 RepID=UPI000EB5FC50|nr:hypothetical protein [Acidovorax sp. 93]RKR26830.1 hypothetical protein C8C93_2079 [Acidovorax sp. 93]